MGPSALYVCIIAAIEIIDDVDVPVSYTLVSYFVKLVSSERESKSRGCNCNIETQDKCLLVSYQIP